MNKETATRYLCSKWNLLILQQYFIYLTHVPFSVMHLSYWILLVHLLAWYILLVLCVPWRQSYPWGNSGWSTSTTTTCPFQAYTHLHIYLDHAWSPFFCHGLVVYNIKWFAIYMHIIFVCLWGMFVYSWCIFRCLIWWWLLQLFDGGFSSVLNGDVVLTWKW